MSGTGEQSQDGAKGVGNFFLKGKATFLLLGNRGRVEALTSGLLLEPGQRLLSWGSRLLSADPASQPMLAALAGVPRLLLLLTPTGACTPGHADLAYPSPAPPDSGVYPGEGESGVPVGLAHILHGACSVRGTRRT